MQHGYIRLALQRVSSRPYPTREASLWIIKLSIPPFLLNSQLGREGGRVMYIYWIANPIKSLWLNFVSYACNSTRRTRLLFLKRAFYFPNGSFISIIPRHGIRHSIQTQ